MTGLERHGQDKSVTRQKLLISIRTILATVIGMMNDAVGRLANGNRPFQGLKGKVFLYPVADRPADDAAGIEAEHDGQVKPTLGRPDAGDIESHFWSGAVASKSWSRILGAAGPP